MRLISMAFLVTLLVAGQGLGQVVVRTETSNTVYNHGWGPRIGLSEDPDQVHFGAHIDYGNFAKHVRFQPNVELGLSDHFKLLTINAEAAYRFSEKWDVWSPYLGGGLGVNIKSYDNDHDNWSDTDLGVNLLGGIEKGLNSGNRFFIEAKISLNDIPDLKVTIGWTFF